MIKTDGVTKPAIVRRYLSLHAGSRLSQSALNADFENLQRLGGFIARVTVDSGAQPASVRLHWIVMVCLDGLGRRSIRFTAISRSRGRFKAPDSS